MKIWIGAVLMGGLLAGCSAPEPVMRGSEPVAVPIRTAAPAPAPAPMQPVARPAPDRPVGKPLAITPPAPAPAEPPPPAVTAAPLALPPPPPGILGATETAALPRPVPAAPAAPSGDRTGYLVGAIGLRDGARLPLVSSFTICDASGRPVASATYDIGKPGALNDGSFDGQPFAFALPEGRYTICESRFQTETGGRPATRTVAIPVEVNAGKANYIGRYIAVSLFDGAGGALQASGFYWLVAGEQRADAAAVAASFPKTAETAHVATLPDLDGAQFRPALKR
jgi:hypothetical protein